MLTGIDALSAGVDQKLWIPIASEYAAKLPKLDDIYLPGAKQMQGLASNQGVCIVFCPAGPVMEYMPDKVKQVPTTAEELLAWAKANPNRFIYARPANSGPGRIFMMGLPYILGDKDPKDPKDGWDKTWAYLKELGQYVEYYPGGTGPVMKELGEGSRDMMPSQMGWDINPRALGVVPKEAKVFFLKGYHWVLDAHYLCIPKGVSNDKLAVLIDLLNYMLSPAGAGDDLRRRLFLSRPGGEGCAAVDGAGREPEGHRGIRPAGIRQGDHRRSAGAAAAAGQAGLCVQPLGRADRLAKEEVTTGKSTEGRRSLSPAFRFVPASSGRSNPQMAIAARDFRELRLDGMSRNFGSVNALKGVTLTVRRGEFIALLGPSGCGKSTALNCLAGLLTLSGGSIWLDKPASTGSSRRSAASAWCSRTTRCFRT